MHFWKIAEDYPRIGLILLAWIAFIALAGTFAEIHASFFEKEVSS